ncbi:MAG: hypothetical protein KC543_15130 [Myxococcales bacterium]|nr:hypothetical protein [Myxococcales bacterium]
MGWVRAFIAGAVSTLVFHQGLFAGMYAAGLVPKAPYDMTQVPPFGVPAVLSLAFFGGLWGIALWACIRRRKPPAYWTLAAALGAIGPTAVAMLLVFPLKGIPTSAKTWVGGLILNGVWGLGVGVCMIAMGARRDLRRGP